jgi:hypothetical protein
MAGDRRLDHHLLAACGMRLPCFVLIVDKAWPYQDIGLPVFNKVEYVRA